MDEQRIREIVREELDDGPQTDRRSVLKALGLAGAGAAAGAAGGAGLTGDAQAADTGTAQVGAPGNPADVYLDRVYDDGGNAVLDIDDTGAIAGQNGRTWDFPALSSLQEFYTPADATFHAVTASNLRSLVDNYDLVVCPPNESVTFDSTKTLTKNPNDNTSLITPEIGNHSGRLQFSIKVSGDFEHFAWTEDLATVTFKGIWFDQTNQSSVPALSVGDGFLFRTEKCLFDSGGTNGIESTGTLHSTRITDCRFNTHSGPSILLTGDEDRIHIQDNYIGETVSGDGIKVDSGSTPHSLTITDNTIADPGGDGIQLQISDTGQVPAISHNIITTPTGRGIITDSAHPVGPGNVVFNGGSDGILAANAFGNIIAACDGGGIVANTGGHVMFNYCVNNGQNGGAPGVEVNFDDGATVAYNWLEDTQSTATQTYGVTVANSADAEIGPNYYNGHATGPFDDAGTRTRLRGAVFLGAAPSGSNYSKEDAGTDIYDTSTSPDDHYVIRADGSLAGPL